MTLNAAGGSSQSLYRSLIVSDVVLLLLILASFVRFPNIVGTWSQEALTGAVILAVPWIISYFALRRLRTQPHQTEVALRWALPSGLILAAIWMVYILFTHLALSIAQKQTLGALLTDITLVLTILIIVIGGLLGARFTRHFVIGLGIGVWIGLIAGLAALITLVAMLEIGMGFLVHNMNAGELLAYRQSGWHDRESWYFWNEEVVGAFSNFVLLVLSGAIFGAIGGVIGKIFSSRQ